MPLTIGQYADQYEADHKMDEKNYRVDVWWNPGDGYRWHCVADKQSEQDATELARYWQGNKNLKSRVIHPENKS